MFKFFLMSVCCFSYVLSHCTGISFTVKPVVTYHCVEYKITVYWGVESQTDSSPNVTAYGQRFDPYNPPRICAVSRDLEKIYRPGDIIHITGMGSLSGDWVVGDRMAEKWTRRIDLLTRPGIWGRWTGERTYEVRKQ